MAGHLLLKHVAIFLVETATNAGGENLDILCLCSGTLLEGRSR